MSLQAWLANGWLATHQSSRAQIADLLAVVDRDLSDARAAQSAGLSNDWRLNIAYNAALQAATAALAAAGFRAARDAHHFRVIQLIQFTVGWDARRVRVLNEFRRKAQHRRI